MELQTLQIVAIFTSLGFMFTQIMVSKKQTSHILFAIFCGSVAMSLSKSMSGNAIGAYQYIIGMGACITCNGYWLLSRSLFRGKKGISRQHLFLASAIALLIMINQGYLFVHNAMLIDTSQVKVIQHILRELTILLSSCILVLSFWEGCRGFSSASQTEKAQRILFLATFGGALVMAKITHGVFADNPVAQETAITCITLFVLINTQILIFWRFSWKQPVKPAKSEIIKVQQQSTISSVKALPTEEALLASQIKQLIVNNALYLQPNLKIADIARKLNIPEYRVSNAIRHNLNARNFNQYINELRVRHAQRLLTDSDKKKWPVLVVGLESGFASVGPFTRSFKAITGFTPNQYRQNPHCN